MISSITKNSRALALFALVTALILAITQNLTSAPIAAAERAAAQKALLEIVPGERFDNDLLLDLLPVPQAYWAMLGLKKGGDVHIARKNGEVVAVIIPALSREGYGGDIQMIIGINRDGTLAGVRVINHKETPGLGDKIDLKKGRWITSFNGKSLGNPNLKGWAVKKDGGDFDQFTGATITPRAVVNQVLKSLQFFAQENALLLDIKEGDGDE